VGHWTGSALQNHRDAESPNICADIHSGLRKALGEQHELPFALETNLEQAISFEQTLPSPCLTITLLGKAIESGEHAFGLTPKVGQNLYFTGSSTAGARVTIVRGFGFPRSAESAYCTTLCKAIQWFQFGAFVDFAHGNKEWFCMSTLHDITSLVTTRLRTLPHSTRMG
jgi:hypothetical protein